MNVIGMGSGSHVEQVLESILIACRVRIRTMTLGRCCEFAHDGALESLGGHFHLVGIERCMLVSGPEAEKRTELHSGDLVLFQSGSGHALLCAPQRRHEANGSSSTLCGEFSLMRCARLMLRGLPQCLVVKADEASDGFRQLTGLLLAAAREARFGQQILVDKLATTLFVFAVCEHAYRTSTADQSSAGIHDARISRALHAIHEGPGKQWSVHALASVAGMSRSAFALRFMNLMGVSPMQYVTLSRIDQAKHLLQNSRLSVATIAEMLGYSSEAAFRKLFKRIEGVGPGHARAVGRSNNLRTISQAVDWIAARNQ
jgi:AraC family transcriptional regulator, activator of mtrCDE